jgi:hypothetical protein
MSYMLDRVNRQQFSNKKYSNCDYNLFCTDNPERGDVEINQSDDDDMKFDEV